jgi:hypothetical protein
MVDDDWLQYFILYEDKKGPSPEIFFAKNFDVMT